MDARPCWIRKGNESYKNQRRYEIISKMISLWNLLVSSSHQKKLVGTPNKRQTWLTMRVKNSMHFLIKSESHARVSNHIFIVNSLMMLESHLNCITNVIHACTCQKDRNRVSECILIALSLLGSHWVAKLFYCCMIWAMLSPRGRNWL